MQMYVERKLLKMQLLIWHIIQLLLKAGDIKLYHSCGYLEIMFLRFYFNVPMIFTENQVKVLFFITSTNIYNDEKCWR